jgi:hypothetical protein
MRQIKKHGSQSRYNKIYQERIACTGKCISRKDYMFPKCCTLCSRRMRIEQDIVCMRTACHKINVTVEPDQGIVKMYDHGIV